MIDNKIPRSRKLNRGFLAGENLNVFEIACRTSAPYNLHNQKNATMPDIALTKNATQNILNLQNDLRFLQIQILRV